ncbi:hypothetical protein CUS73_01905 [Enterococcus faecalis]|nr:hypothetical protein CUS73_01905 [Enterococcus faecalis]
MQNFTTYAHYTEKQLVSKKSEDNHGIDCRQSKQLRKSLSIKGFFFYPFLQKIKILVYFPSIALDFPKLTTPVVKNRHF